MSKKPTLVEKPINQTNYAQIITTASDPILGLTPARFHAILMQANQGDWNQYIRLSGMIEERFWHYNAVLQVRKNAILGCDMMVQPFDDSAKSAQVADFVKQSLIPLRAYLPQGLDAIGKGFSFGQIIWQQSANAWLPSEITFTDQRAFGMVENQLKIINMGEFAQPAPDQWLFLKFPARQAPFWQAGLARSVGWAWIFASSTFDEWYNFIKLYGKPAVVGKYNNNASKDEQRKLLRAVQAIGREAASVIPDTMALEMLNASKNGGGGGGSVHEQLITKLELLMSKIVLGQTTTTDAIAGGHAVSREHNQVRADILLGDLENLKSQITEQYIKPIVRFNFGEVPLPIFIMGQTPEDDMTEFRANVELAQKMGVPLSKSQFYRVTKLEKPKQDDILTAPTPPTTAPAKNTAQLCPVHHNAADAPNDAQKPDEFDSLNDVMMAEFQANSQNDIAVQLMAKLQTAQNYDEFQVILNEFEPNLQPISDILARGQFNAHIYGRGNNG